MKIKLIIIDTFTDNFYRSNEKKNTEYFISDLLHMDHWRYSPERSSKVIETYFG